MLSIIGQFPWLDTLSLWISDRRLNLDGIASNTAIIFYRQMMLDYNVSTNSKTIFKQEKTDVDMD